MPDFSNCGAGDTVRDFFELGTGAIVLFFKNGGDLLGVVDSREDNLNQMENVIFESRAADTGFVALFFVNVVELSLLFCCKI